MKRWQWIAMGLTVAIGGYFYYRETHPKRALAQRNSEAQRWFAAASDVGSVKSKLDRQAAKGR